MRLEMVEVAPGIHQAVEVDICPECKEEVEALRLGPHGLCDDCDQLFVWDDDGEED